MARTLQKSKTRVIVAALIGGLSLIWVGCGGGTRIAGSTSQNGGGTNATVVTTIYAGSSVLPSISAFNVGANGHLTSVTGSPFVASGETEDMAITQKFLLTRSPTAITSFTIDPFGTLTTSVATTFARGATGKIAVDPSGTFLYVVSAETRILSALAIDSVTGALTEIAGSPVSTVSAGTGGTPGPILITPDGKFVFVGASVARGGGQIISYSRDATTGALTLLSEGVFTSPLASPDVLALNPTGSFVFASDAVNKTIDSFSNANGTVTQVGSVAVPASLISDIRVDPSGNFLVAADVANSRIEVFRIGADGTLTPATGSPVTLNVPTSPAAIAFVAGFVFIGSNVSQNISAFQLNSTTGVLTAIPASSFSAGLPVTRLIGTGNTPSGPGLRD